MAGPFRLAVDLGTCNTVAVVDRGDGAPRALLFDGTPLLPSSTFVDRGGAVFVGRDAERLLMTDPARFEPHPKGRVDDGTVLLGDREFAVVDLFAALLRRVSTEAGQAGVRPAGATVLTCPADWGRRRRAVLLAAADAAGLGPVVLLDEPVAAATYCLSVLGRQIAPGRCVTVFDFGGGTLDVTVVQHDPAGLRVLATGGLDDLGGTDVDDALVGHLGQLVSMGSSAIWQRLASPTTSGELRDRRMFWTEVRAAKEMLSRAASAPVHVPGDDRPTHLTREELERVAGPLVDRAVDETRRVLQRSGIGPDRLAAILLVGGSSRLPLVASRLHARFGLAPIVPEQPELPVAYGALLLANSGGAATTEPVTAAPVRTAPVSAAPVTTAPGTAAPVDAAPVGTAPVDAASTGAVVRRPDVGDPGAVPAAAPGPAQLRRRPSVIIGPGVTIQGNVAVYGDADLMPEDDPLPSTPPPAPHPPDGTVAGAPAGPGKAALKRRRSPLRLRFLLLPVLPWVLIMALTPWGRGLVTDLKDAAAGVFAGPSTGASRSPSPAPASMSPVPLPPAPTGPQVTLDHRTGPAGVPVTMTGTGFLASEPVEVFAGTRRLAVRTAGKDGTLTYTFTPRAEKLTTRGPLLLTMTAGQGRRIATVTYTIS